MGNLTEITNKPAWVTTPLLSRSLGSQDLDKHRAFVGLELEVLAKKFDRFGWDRDRGSIAHDRMLSDWMDALQDYGLDEIQAACRQAVLDFPNKQPNEGHIRNLVMKQRGRYARPPEPVQEAHPEPTVEQKKRAAKIIADAGYGKVK